MNGSRRLHERSQNPKTTYDMILFIRPPRKGKTIRMENRSVLARHLGRGVLTQRVTGGYCGVMELFHILIWVVATCLHAFVKL